MIITVTAFTLFICGFAQRGELGRHVMLSFFGLWMTVCLRHALLYYREAQYEGATLFLVLAFMYMGDVLLARSERWIATVLWFGSCFTAVSAAVGSYEFSAPYNPGYFFLSQGLLFLTVASAMEIGRSITSRASLSIVATELAAYNAVWAQLLQSSPAGFGALCLAAHGLLVTATCAADKALVDHIDVALLVKIGKPPGGGTHVHSRLVNRSRSTQSLNLHLR
jgi:hypothetical protein